MFNVKSLLDHCLPFEDKFKFQRGHIQNILVYENN